MNSDANDYADAEEIRPEDRLPEVGEVVPEEVEGVERAHDPLTTDTDDSVSQDEVEE